MYFFVRTVMPRATFPADMSETERAVMQAHVQYWTQQGRAGTAVLFGPVLDPAGVFGIAVARVDDADALDSLLAADPARDLLQPYGFPMGDLVICEPDVG
jgi:uncharacterized protein